MTFQLLFLLIFLVHFFENEFVTGVFFMGKNFFSDLVRILSVGMTLVGLLFSPQYSVSAAAILTVEPITWNMIGLDSNNVNDGPNNFPVGTRVCNTGDTPATNVTADFIWDSANANINLRPGSLDPIILPTLNNGDCFDFYFEVVITRTAVSYDTTRQFHIDVTADGLGTISTPTPRELYVERLVSQNRNSVLDVQLDGVSIAAGGTMNLVVGNTYTITLISDTATNGYEQIETFINFPNTIFQVLSVATTYAANAGTDPDAGSKLYADGCGWDDATRTCTATGKYGGLVTIEYVVQVISGGGTSEPLNTLIYDFSGSSFHYNSDFALSTRIANISDPASCVQQTIAQWTFNNVTTPSTGAGAFSAVGVSGPTYAAAPGNVTNPAVAFTGWDNNGSGSEYLQFAVSTVGYYAVQFSFGAERAGNQAPTTATVLYSSNGTTFTAASPNVTLPNNGAWTNFPAFDFSSVSALDSNSNTVFRLYAFGGNSGTQTNRSVYFDDVTVTGCALPAAINIEKSGVVDQTIVAPSDETNVGDRVNYTIVITNTGGVPLTGITLTDSQADSLTCIPVLAGLTLQPGESVTCTGYRTLTQDDFDVGFVTNLATADSNQVGPVSDLTTQTLPQSPSLDLEKTSDVQTYTTVGDVVTYTYTLTNTGNVTLTAPYSVTDNKTTVDCSLAASPLLPGESTTCTATYEITQADVDAGSATNLATATARFGDSDVVSNEDSVTVNYAALNIVKEVSTDNANWDDTSVTVNVGDAVYYRIRVENTGNVILTGFTVDDGMAGCTLTRGADAPGNDDADFEPGEIWVYTCSVIAIEGAQNNTATADSNETDQDSDDASYFGANPALSVVKSENFSGPYATGDTINYDIVVTNTGNIILTGVTVVDNFAVVGFCTPTQPSTLAPGESMTCPASHVVTQVDIDNGSYSNTATADSNETPPSDSTVIVTLAQNPGISIIKSSNATGTNAVGDTITYTYEVENTGDVTLTNVTVTDAHVGLSVIACIPAQGSTLNPSETMTCTATYTVTQADLDAGKIDNTGEVAGTPPTGPNLTDSDPLSEPVAQDPQFEIVKSETSSGPYYLDDTIAYDIVVTNTGNITLTGVTVTDNSADLGTCTPVQPSTLAPGDVMTCPASHVVTQTDLGNKSYVNTATADSNETPPGDSTVTVNFGDADLSLVKTVSNTTPIYGRNINFVLTVTNDGPEAATGVEVTDNLPGGFTFISASASKGTYSNATGLWQIGDLAFNEIVTLNMTVRVNNAGPYTNTAEISASLILDPDSTPDNNDPSEDDQDSATVTPRERPDPSPPPPQTPLPAVGGFLIPVTGFAPDVVTDMSQSPPAVYTNTSITLDIPLLSVNIPIVGVPKQAGAWNVSWLGNQAGWLEGSAFPSWNGNSVLTSHVYLSNGKPGPFAKLHELQTGDHVYVHAFGQKYTFMVLTNAIIAPTDSSVMRHEERPWLTLVTCTDYDPTSGTYKNRFIVRAVLVKVSDQN